MVAVHVAVLLFGLAGLFAKLVPLPALAIVWWRNIFAVVALACAVAAQKEQNLPTGRARWAMVGIGALLAVHWVTFFHAIQVSTVAVGLLSFSTFPVIVAFIEPMLTDEKFHRAAVLYAIVAFLGVALVVEDFQLGSKMTEGAIVGVLSGALWAFVNVLNRSYVRRFDALSIGLWQNGAAFVLLLPLAAKYAVQTDPRSLLLLALLGVVFTGGAHTLFIHGMRTVSARVAALVGALEPVYGVVAAAVLLGEIPSPRAIGGGALIVATVAAATRRSGARHP